MEGAASTSSLPAAVAGHSDTLAPANDFLSQALAIESEIANAPHPSEPEGPVVDEVGEELEDSPSATPTPPEKEPHSNGHDGSQAATIPAEAAAMNGDSHFTAAEPHDYDAMEEPPTPTLPPAPIDMALEEQLPEPDTSVISGPSPREGMLTTLKKVKPDKKAILALQHVCAEFIQRTTFAPNATGVVNVKQELDSHGNKSKLNKSFKKYYGELRGCVLMFYTDNTKTAVTIGPLYIPSYATKLDYVKKKGEMLRISALQGTFVVQATEPGQLDLWKQQLSTPASLTLDCVHYISSESKDALEAFVSRSLTISPVSNAVRLSVTMLGLSGSGKTSIIRQLTTQVCPLASTCLLNPLFVCLHS
jgi:hypothetical protein